MGRWNIARSIAGDDVPPEGLVCTGSATLREHGDALAYDESVSFVLAGKRVHATRAYTFAESHGIIVASFADGAPFFQLALSADGRGTAVHHCGPDRYFLTLHLRDPVSWETRWDVSGSKTVQLITRYTR